jgi:hypothetical protein
MSDDLRRLRHRFAVDIDGFTLTREQAAQVSHAVQRAVVEALAGLDYEASLLGAAGSGCPPFCGGISIRGIEDVDSVRRRIKD